MRAGVLVRNEALKTWRRVAFWVALAASAGIVLLLVGQGLYWGFSHPGTPFTFTLPQVWGRYLQNLGPLPAIFGAVAVVLLVTAEFSWKTARQNVIDGLSKEEFFAGKLLTWLGVMLAFFAVTVAIVGGAGLVGTHHAGASGPFVRKVDVAIVGGGLLGALGYSSIAFFSAFLTRSSGSGMGLFLLYVGFVEPILGASLRRAGDVGKAMAGFLPRGTFDRLMQAAQYDLTVRQELIDRALKAGRQAPHFLPTGELISVAALWVVVFLALSFWVYERRDL